MYMPIYYYTGQMSCTACLLCALRSCWCLLKKIAKVMRFGGPVTELASAVTLPGHQSRLLSVS